MPSLDSTPVVSVYTSSRDVPQHVKCAMHSSPCRANVILAHLDAIPKSATNQLWMVCETRGLGEPSSRIEFVLGCFDGSMKAYPIVIFANIDHVPTSEYVRCRLEDMAKKLMSHVPPSRVFSIFAPDRVAECFAMEWTKCSGIPREPDSPYYHANLKYCDKRSFNDQGPHTLEGYTCNARRATPVDEEKVGMLCHRFAELSFPFVLTSEEARNEAAMLIKKGQVWVYEVVPGGGFGEREIASIVAATRTSCSVTAITKVVTNDKWLKKGCARALTGAVTKELLEINKSVVLYVAHDNPAASSVYRRVGFVGPDPLAPSAEESWKEIGFDRRQVTLGHW
ncbi:hypothetical protein NLI96_g10664 [Meripilus lineatus]|uniref:GCN5-related N-acetyltransferase Rv2170-like domain-containing protein n=1 Tax=Meripilus lineatus TaxID=2056292 RepID=A0AAD5UT70_9APHY|nr:hypothetical protein NLI96_g10664 [Physisporinus lineatus]